MFVQQLYTACISEAAYYIESEGVAAIIDPLRDIDIYLQLAKERKATIKYIFETHFHADFVSGHLDLAAATGATIVFGPQTKTKYAIHVAKDEEVFTLGKCTITVLHTPGHTIESCCYLLKDELGKDYAVFTGDTLFVGDVGRPDLSQEDDEHNTMRNLATMLYHSLQSKIIPLADDVLVYPAHGAGSSCGKNIGKETFSTIGEQKQTNYALQEQTVETFIIAVTTGLQTAPVYFSVNAKMNKEGYIALNTIIDKGLTALSINAFQEKINKNNCIILDTRPSHMFVNGFIPDAIFIGLEGRFAEWAGSILPFHQPIVLVTELGKEKETITRLARVGFDKIEGYLDGGFEEWQNNNLPIDLLIEVEADELAMDIPFDDNLIVVDVRKEVEYDDGHLKQSINIPLEEMTDPASMVNLDEHHNIYLHCAGGYRSVIAASLLKKQGIHNIRNIAGGWKSIDELKERFTIEKTTSALN
jgi:hydroxyacylglutathione hydrolase